MIDEIKSYYEKRGLKEPTALEALMWMISEVGELVEAYKETACRENENASAEDNYLHYLFTGLCGWCEDIENFVAKRSGWVRNNQPKGTYDLPGECADVLMMLSVFADKAGLPEPETCLREKMERKLRNVQR